MNVQVIDGLPTIVSGVDHGSKTLGESPRTRNLSRSPMQVSQKRIVFFFGLYDRGNVLARNDQDMDRRLWLDIREGIAVIVLVNRLGRNAPIDDLAENAAHGLSL